MRRLAGAAALGVLLIAAGCKTPDTAVAPKLTPTPSPTATGTPRASDTPTPEPPAEPESVTVFAERGLFPVGVTTIDVGEREAEVWYPGDADDVGTASTEQLQTDELFPEGLAGLHLVPNSSSDHSTGGDQFFRLWGAIYFAFFRPQTVVWN